MTDDERLRRLLEDAVSDIEPRDSLSSIHARTKVSFMNSKRSWLLGAGAAVVATAATVVAVAVLSDDGTTEDPGFAGSPATASPQPSSEPATPTPSEEPSKTAAPETATVPVYYVGETTRGTRLFREFHRVETGGDPLGAALTEAVSTVPDDPDYRTDWPEGTTARGTFDGADGEISVILRNDAVDLRQRPGQMTPEQADLAVEQLIYTAQAATQTRAPVQFYLEREGATGNRTDMLLGVPVSEPLAQGTPEDVLAQVWIIEPGEGAEVTSPFTVSGLAAAFEANVVWELRQGEKVVREGFTTAEECCKMEPYSFEVSAPPGEYTLVVQDTDPSGGEGFGPWEDTKRVTVVP